MPSAPVLRVSIYSTLTHLGAFNGSRAPQVRDGAAPGPPVVLWPLQHSQDPALLCLCKALAWREPAVDVTVEAPCGARIKYQGKNEGF